jgi:CRP-like cAMP-binding protein
MKEINPTSVRRFYCFWELNSAEALQAAGHIEPVQLQAREVLFRQGDPGDHLYLVVSGTVELRASAHGGTDRVLATLHPSAIFGEICLLLDEPRTATAVALTEARLWGISRARFEQALAAGEQWAKALLLATSRVLARRLSMVDQQLMSLAAKPGPGDAPAGRTELEQLRSQLSQWPAGPSGSES